MEKEKRMVKKSINDKILINFQFSKNSSNIWESTSNTISSKDGPSLVVGISAKKKMHVCLKLFSLSHEMYCASFTHILPLLI